MDDDSDFHQDVSSITEEEMDEETPVHNHTTRKNHDEESQMDEIADEKQGDLNLPRLGKRITSMSNLLADYEKELRS